MSNWITELHNAFKLRTKILVAIILVVVIFTGLGLYQMIAFYAQSAMKQLAQFSRDQLENTHSAIKYPMEVGDSKTVEEQFKDIKQNMSGAEVYVTDFRQEISYASEADRLHNAMERYLPDAEAQKALAYALKSGKTPENCFTEKNGDTPFMVTIKPLLNEPSCHHCHGASQKVLGAMIFKQPMKGVYSTLATARNRMLIFYGAEIIGIILSLTLLLGRLVTRRIRLLAEQSSRVSAGDITVEIWDDAHDSIGALTRNFSQMIKNLRDRMEYANSLKIGISDPFFMVDPDMKLSYINDAAARLAGVHPEEVAGIKTCEQVFASDVCRSACPVRHALKTGESSLGNRISMLNASGKRVYLMASSAALKDSTGKILGAFEIIRDLTKEVEAEAMLKDAYLKEEEAKDALQERVQGLSAIFTRVAAGDLTARAEAGGEGDAMDQLVEKTNETLQRMEELISQTQRAALTVVSGVNHISRGNQALAERTEQQAAAMEETSATIEELIASISQNTLNTQRADSLSKEAVAVAQVGGATVTKTAQAMAEMAEASRKVVEMMSLINEITFQTNLLSINAAVEAARAGDQGRGFAVVANEVRNLAKRSSEASKDIQNLVHDIREKVANGKDWVGELETGFNKIISTIQQVSDSLTDVSLATQESSLGIEQIGRAMNEMTDVIEHNAALVDELAGATDKLNDKAALLQRMTNKFVLREPVSIDAADATFGTLAPPTKKDNRLSGWIVSRPVRKGGLELQLADESVQQSIETGQEGGFDEF
jgi:PAS domain S-box-containing protein